MVNEINVKLISKLLPERSDNSHKGSFGKILNIAGSRMYSGAALLSSLSALKIGAGYLSLACIDEIINRIASICPEITFIPLESTIEGTISTKNEILNLSKYDVISIGCGLTTNKETMDFTKNFLKKINRRQKLIIDADGINILANFKDMTHLKNTIITPHPKELARLLNVSVTEIVDNRKKYARITSQTFECITILKGHNTIITDGDVVYQNTTGNSALAKAGSGDVLTGIIAGLLAQKMEIFEAGLLGIFLHGLAGDIASRDLTKYSVLATDIIKYVPQAIKEVIKVGT